jgi:hypothetical protein
LARKVLRDVLLRHRARGGSGLGTVPILWKTPRDAERLREDDLMLRESPRLVAYLCTKYGI